jgi:excisionase family DNA binding protein
MAAKVGDLQVENSPRSRSKNTRGETRRRAQGDATEVRLLDVREAASLLGLKPSTLYQWAYKRRIPIVKLLGPRGALRFRLSDVEKLIQDSLRPAIRPLGPKD